MSDGRGTPSTQMSPPEEEGSGSYAGWYIGVGIIVAVLGIGMVLWFTYHP